MTIQFTRPTTRANGGTLTSPIEADKPSLETRIEDLRDVLFGAMAIVSVVSESINSEEDYCRHRALKEAHSQLYDIGLEMNEISGDVRTLEKGTAALEP